MVVRWLAGRLFSVTCPHNSPLLPVRPAGTGRQLLFFLSNGNSVPHPGTNHLSRMTKHKLLISLQLFPSKSDMSLLKMHIVFCLIAATTLSFPVLTIGVKMLVIVISYNILLPLWSLINRESVWIDIWLFVLPLSIMQIFPDWFLADVLNSIVFEADPYIMIGDVPAYMGGLWAIPLFVITYLGLRAKEQNGAYASLILVSIISLILFVGAEATLWMLPAWNAQNVLTISHVALYIIIPEILLGLSTFLAYEIVQGRRIVLKVVLAFVVMILYIGNASLFYFILERLILG